MAGTLRVKGIQLGDDCAATKIEVRLTDHWG